MFPCVQRSHLVSITMSKVSFKRRITRRETKGYGIPISIKGVKGTRLESLRFDQTPSEKLITLVRMIRAKNRTTRMRKSIVPRTNIIIGSYSDPSTDLIMTTTTITRDRFVFYLSLSLSFINILQQGNRMGFF